MRSRARKWVLILGMVTPTLFAGCPQNIGLKLFNAAVDGASAAVEDEVFDFLQDLLPPAEED